MNTAMIIATQMADNQTGNFAAKVCADYSVTDGGVTYGDWYLPSKYELNLLYLQRTAVGGFASAYYWSSTEYPSNNRAWSYYFAYGYSGYDDKNNTYRVRAVRASSNKTIFCEGVTFSLHSHFFTVIARATK
jgi:hypothetical protein